ncbi:MAG: FIST signal transduction protein [Granulosicoccaceae bacterium]
MLGKGCFKLLQDTQVDALERTLRQLQDEGKKSALVFACAGNGYQASDLTPILQSLEIQVVGAIFPSIISGAKLFENGAIVISYDQALPASIYHNISQNADKQRIADNLKGPWPTNLIVLADALCGGMENFIDRLYQQVGSGLQVIGGGAGSLDFVRQPCLISNEGFIQDAAIVARLPAAISTASGHGWHVLEGPFVITEADGHDIISINYQPAFELYRDTICKISGDTLNELNFFKIAKNYPFGIAELSGELLVRDPIVCQSGRITCVGNVPQNATVYILHADAQSLISAADDTAAAAFEEQTNPSGTAILFDCISRQLYLGDKVAQELSHIEDKLPTNSHMAGAFTLGEIANHHGGPIQLMNKSMVLASF